MLIYCLLDSLSLFGYFFMVLSVILFLVILLYKFKAFRYTEGGIKKKDKLG